jgi:hypothetical protein
MKIATIIALVALLAAAGCGGDDASDRQGALPPATSLCACSPPATPATKHKS